MIRRLKYVISFVLLLFGISTAMAASIQCGTQIISDDQRNGQTKSEVLELCGEPTSKKMNTWYYKQPDGATFRLHFNGSGELESIQEEVD